MNVLCYYIDKNNDNNNDNNDNNNNNNNNNHNNNVFFSLETFSESKFFFKLNIVKDSKLNIYTII